MWMVIKCGYGASSSMDLPEQESGCICKNLLLNTSKTTNSSFLQWSARQFFQFGLNMVEYIWAHSRVCHWLADGLEAGWSKMTLVRTPEVSLTLPSSRRVIKTYSHACIRAPVVPECVGSVHEE